MQFLITIICGLVCLSAVYGVPVSDDMMKHVKEIMDKCAAKLGIEPGMMEQAKKGEIPDKEKMDCFGACVFQELGFLDEDGTAHPEVAIGMLPDSIPKDEATKLIETCTKEKGATACETAGNIFKCVHESKKLDLLKMLHE